MYRCEAQTVEGFVQQLALAYLHNGYCFYVAGLVPEHKDPAAVDAKLLERYGVDRSKWSRVRQRERGEARVHYLRHQRYFLLLASVGQHPFFDLETTIQDARREPIVCFGYRAGYWPDPTGKLHVSVKLTSERYELLRAQLVRQATRLMVEEFDAEVRRLRLALFVPVQRQLRRILDEVNARRREVGLEAFPLDFEQLRRRPVKPFAARNYMPEE